MDGVVHKGFLALLVCRAHMDREAPLASLEILAVTAGQDRKVNGGTLADLGREFHQAFLDLQDKKANRGRGALMVALVVQGNPDFLVVKGYVVPRDFQDQHNR